MLTSLLIQRTPKNFFMKKMMTSILMSLVFLQVVRSQDTLPSPKTYNAVIKYRPEGFVKPSLLRGYFVSIQDSSLYVSRGKMPVNFKNANLSALQKIDYKNLVSAKLYNRGKNVLTILLCAVAGAGIGALIGQAGGNDTSSFGLFGTAGEKAAAGALIGGGVGSLIGIVISKAQEKHFLINGEWKSLQEMKEGLLNNQ
jgi:hypothetical protein